MSLNNKVENTYTMQMYHFSNRKVLDLLKQRNGKSLKGLMLEVIEALAVKYRLVQDSTNIRDWSDLG